MHLSTFEAQWAELNRALRMEDAERDAAIDPFFVSTFLAVLAMGLVSLTFPRMTFASGCYYFLQP